MSDNFDSICVFLGFCYGFVKGDKMKKPVLLLLYVAALFLTGCGKAGLKDPVFLPGLGETFHAAKDHPHEPIFNNGDIVRYRMLRDKRGIIMRPDYKYLPDLGTWYCIVDFYPSSALIHFDFSEFDNYERRYVYEFELKLVRKYSKHNDRARNRWIRN